ncbi:MAG: hypothetical protein PVF58_21315 [Candidatus Methanofastidiosia archaeon]
MSKRNIVGLTDEQLKKLLSYCKFIRKNPRASFSAINRNLKLYERDSSLIDLVRKSLKRSVITGPFLYANTGIDVKLAQDGVNSRKLYFDALKNENTTLVMELDGKDLSLIHFKYGASALQFFDAILPNSYNSNCEFLENFNINEDEKGKLKRDPYPHGWDKLDWRIYWELHDLRVKFLDIARKLDLTVATVSKRFKEIFKESKALITFFPFGIKNYNYQVTKFKTDYELGIISALKTLNQTTYVYKAYEKLILVFFLPPDGQSVNKFTRQFREMEEIGLIRNLCISTPFRYHNVF